MTVNKKTSLLIPNQVPEHVLEENPLFVSFLEAYYEFLENKVGTEKNDLLTQAGNLRYVSDVDFSIDAFEDHFFNTFADLFPKEIAVDRNILIKNVLPVYLSKGSEKSFKFLFRLLFGEELNVSYPKNDVLRASDGKWLIDTAIRTTTNIFSTYTGDGSETVFNLAECRCPLTDEPLPISITVFINGVEITSGFQVRPEYKKLIFDFPPSEGDNIEVYYRNYDFDQFVNREVVGLTSGARAVIEKIFTKTVSNQRVLELYVNRRKITGTFEQGEIVESTTFSNNVLIKIRVDTISILDNIQIINGGSSYNVGDPVLIDTPVFIKEPSAEISKVFSGVINEIQVLDGGAGFEVAKKVTANGISTLAFDLAIANVNTSGANTPNTYVILSNVISDVDPSNTTISSTDYGFLGNSSLTGVVDSNTQIVRAFPTLTFNFIGEISNVSILVSEISFDSQPELIAEPASVIVPATANTPTDTEILISSFGSLGKLIINSRGLNYQKGDELIFINQKMSFGQGAEAEVDAVDSEGRILSVKFVPSKISGLVSTTSVGNVMVSGVGTEFTSELIVGDDIMIHGETRKVAVIDSDVSLNLDSTLTSIVTNKPIRKFGLNLLGGQSYTQDKLPSVFVDSANGSGANIVVTTLMGKGENLLARGTKLPGEIEEIIITDPGEGLLTNPIIDLTQFGDGNALAVANLSGVLEVLPGRWTTSDSILSSSERKLQGRNYYTNYSYLLSSKVEFSKYKRIFNELLHPAGFRAFAEYNRLDEINTELSLETLVSAKTIRTLSGLVSVNGTSIVIGTNTRFETANTLGLLTIGSYVAINSEIRIVDTIVSNTEFTVTVPFTSTISSQELIVINTAYEAVATETLEEILAENELVLTVET
jgi:hypothetical protein